MDTSGTNDIFYIKDNILIGSQTLDLDNIQNCINIGDLILKSFKSNPNFIGLVTPFSNKTCSLLTDVDAATGEENTFQYMREKSVKCALWMQKSSIQPNDAIMICTNNQLDAYVPFLASLYIGAVVSPLDEFFIDNLDYFSEQVKPAMLFINEMYYMTAIYSLNQLKILKGIAIPKIIVFSDKYKDPLTRNKNLLTLEAILNDNYDSNSIEFFSCAKVINMRSIAMRLFTSGTTAFPTHIQIPHLAFIAPSDQHAPNMFQNDIALLFESLCFINGIFITIQAILLHVKIIKINSYFNVEIACKIIQKYRVTWAFLETCMCYQLIKFYEFKEYDISSLKKIVFCGSTTNSLRIQICLKETLPNVSIIQAYSLTETGIIAYQRHSRKNGSCGYVSANVQLKIVSLYPLDQEKLLGPNKSGEIYCSSPYMMIGHEAEELHGFNNWYGTGDLGYYDEDGDIFIIDRMNQLFEVNNHIILPTEIENVLQMYFAVFEAVVTSIPNRNKNKDVIAFVTKVSGLQVTETDLQQWVKNNLSSNNQLHHVIFLERLPRFSNGKINRKLLYNIARSHLFW